MFVEVKRCKDVDLEEKIYQATYNYGQQLFTRQLWPYIEIEVRLLKSIRDYGYCSCLDVTNAHGKPRGFEVVLKSTLSEHDMLTTLAHEMTHVHQFATGKLSDTHEKWLSTKIPEDTNYNDLPWEVEAVCMETVLYQTYIRSLDEPQRPHNISETNNTEGLAPSV
jgi:hypothetical protein